MKEIVNRRTTLPAKMNVDSKIKRKLQVGHPTVKSGKKEAKKKKGSTQMKSKTAAKISKHLRKMKTNLMETQSSLPPRKFQLHKMI